MDAAIVEPRHIEITKQSVHLDKLPKELDGLRIAQLSDLHRSSIVPDDLISSAVDMTNSLSPDVIVLTGDFVNTTAANAGPCAKILSHLKPAMGTYAVLGNHDHWTDASSITRALEKHGIKVLKNENTRIVDGLFLLGLDDYWAGQPDFVKTWKGADQDAAHIFLCHNPLAADAVRDKKCLMISGHTHGGQVNIPFVPRALLPGLKGWEYIKGWYTVGQTRLYVNRGIGMIRPAVRFMCRPEITLFTLRSAK